MSALPIDQSRAPRVGDRVQILYHPAMKGRITEFRGRIGYKGRELFGVELDYTDHTSYIEVARDQLVYLDDGNDPNHPNPPTTH